MARHARSIPPGPVKAPAAAGAGAGELIFLSHCVPNPPDKGEKIRAYHELRWLTERWRVHLVCFARSEHELEDALALRERCASIYVELLPRRAALARAALRFAAGRSLTESFYRSASMMEHVRSLRGRPVYAALAYSSAMAQYAPAGTPMFLDLIDVDSEKWLEFSERRRLGFLYRREALRLREVESGAVRRALRTVVVTEQERAALERFAPGSKASVVENGVDLEYFDPAAQAAPENKGPAVAFVGAMDYFPNAEAASWFAAEVFQRWRQTQPGAQFWIVGRNPGAAVRRLGSQTGITVTGAVADVRPYVNEAWAVVAPLKIARGVQNKVLESLAMGKRVLASPEVVRCFGSEVPKGVLTCRTPEEYLAALSELRASAQAADAGIREEARRRFSWAGNLAAFGEALDSIGARAAEPAVERVS